MALLALIPYYNPLGWERRYRNLGVTCARLREQGVTFWLLNAYHGNRPAALADMGAQRVMTFPALDALWHKERLFNLAVPSVPADVRAVALLDGDVLFDNPAWASCALDMIDKGCHFVQPFEHAAQAAPDGLSVQPSRPSCTANLKRLGRPADGHPGYAVVASRKVVDACPVYDRLISGGGDSLLFCASTGMRMPRVTMLGVQFHTEMMEWYHRWDALVQRQCDYVEGRLVHQWHGDLALRRYHDRYVPLIEMGIRPAWLSDRPGRLLQWSAAAPAAVRQHMLGYFKGRREDG